MQTAVFIFLTAAFAAAVNGAPQVSTSTTTTTTTKAPSSTTAVPIITPPNSENAKNLTFVLSGSDLPTKDAYSEVDAFVKMYTKTGDAEEVKTGKSEVIQDNKDPEWSKVFWFYWTKGTGDKLRFVVRDNDVLEADDEVGEVTIDVDEYVKKGQDLTVSLSEGGKLRIRKTQPIAFKLHSRNLPRMDQLNGKSDPYVEVSWRRGKEGTNHLIGTSAVIDNTDNPDWTETFEFANLEKGTDQYLHFKVYDSDAISTDDVLGELLVEADAFAANRVVTTRKLENSNGNAVLVITPVDNKVSF